MYLQIEAVRKMSTDVDIDRDYLLNNITEWQAMLTDENEKKLLTEVIHCIKAKDTIVDMQKLIDGVNYQKLDLDSAEEKDVKAASIYNSAIEDSLYEIQSAVYPNYKASFVWDKTCEEIHKERYEDYLINKTSNLIKSTDGKLI